MGDSPQGLLKWPIKRHNRWVLVGSESLLRNPLGLMLSQDDLGGKGQWSNTPGPHALHEAPPVASSGGTPEPWGTLCSQPCCGASWATSWWPSRHALLHGPHCPRPSHEAILASAVPGYDRPLGPWVSLDSDGREVGLGYRTVRLGEPSSPTGPVRSTGPSGGEGPSLAKGAAKQP